MKRFLCTSEDEEPRVHFITAGDFTQLPPCFEKFIFEDPQFASEHFEPNNQISSAKRIRADHITVFHLWRTFEIVVKLTEKYASCQRS